MGKTTPFNLHQPFEVSSLNPNKNQWFIHARKKLSKLSKPNQPSEQWKEGPWGCLGYKGIFSGNETNYTAYGKFWGIIFIIIPSFFADPKGFPSLYKQQPGYISMEIHIPPTGVVLFSRWLLQALFIRPQNPRLKRVDFLDSLGFAASRHHFCGLSHLHPVVPMGSGTNLETRNLIWYISENTFVNVHLRSWII